MSDAVNMPNTHSNARSRAIDEIFRQTMRARPNSREYVVALLVAADAISAIDGALFERTAREACTVAEFIADWDVFAEALAKHAWALFRSGDLGQALLRAEHAAHIARQRGDSKSLNSACHTIASIRAQIGDVATAAKLWLGLINSAMASKDVVAEARSRLMLGLCLANSRQTEEARDQYLQAHRLFDTINDGTRALAANNIAATALEERNHPLAESWIVLANQSCAPDASLWRSYIAHTEGQLALATSRYADARAAFARALEVLPGERDDVSHTANLYLDIGRLHIVEGAATKALASLDHALILAEDSGDAALVAKVHDALHDAYEKIGDFDSALRHCRKRGAALTRSAAAKSAEQIAVLKAAEALVHERAKWAAVRYSA